MYYLETGSGKHNRLRNAVTLAVVLHVAVILGISFDAARQADGAPQIEVTLVTRPDAGAPDDARLIAAANQRGTGDQAQVYTPGAPVMPRHAAQQAPDTNSTRQETLTTTAELQRDQRDARRNEERVRMQASLQEQAQDYAEHPRVRRLSQASALQSADAAYLLDWRRRLEAVGNKYYPAASLRYGIYGKVRLLVVIRADGSLEDIRVLSSSGYAVLDEAAIKVVRMAAPYSPFPPELRATTDKLEIIRTWHYEENALSSG